MFKTADERGLTAAQFRTHIHRMARKAAVTVGQASRLSPKSGTNETGATPVLCRTSLLDTRVVHCGDDLEQLAKLPDACEDLICIDPSFNSNRNDEAPSRTRQTQMEIMPYEP
jgi:hypothetical protein